MLKTVPSLRIPALLFSAMFILYLYNLSSSVYGGDSGDFIAASSTNGIPHPSGYPLYMLIGIILLHLPLQASEAWKFGISSAIFSALAVSIVYLINHLLTNNKLMSIIGALILALCFPFWLYAEIVEVFALHHLFIALCTYLALLYYKTPTKKILYLLSFTFGLSLTNNLTMFLLIPGLALLVLLPDISIIKNPKVLVYTSIFFFIGLLPYIYLPIAASYNPAINFGNPITMVNFWNVVSRKYYGWGGSELGKFDFFLALLNLQAYGNYLYVYFIWILLIPTVIGILSLFKKGSKLRTVGLSLLISFMCTGPLFAFYSRTELQSYGFLAVREKFYTTSIIYLVIFLAIGLNTIDSFVKKLPLQNTKKLVLYAWTACLLVVPASLFFTNYTKTNLHEVYIGDNFARDILSSMPQDSIFFAHDDSVVFTSFYMQYTKGYRKDIIIPGNHEGYQVVLKESGFSKEESSDYGKKFGNTLSKELLYNIIANLVEHNNVYTDTAINDAGRADKPLISVPYGFIYKVYLADNLHLSKEEFLKTTEDVIQKYHIEKLTQKEDIINEHLYLSQIRRFYAVGYLNIAQFLSSYYKDPQTAYIYYEKAYDLDPLLEEQKL